MNVAESSLSWIKDDIHREPTSFCEAFAAMKSFMSAPLTRFMFQGADPVRMELVLSRHDGTPWTLTMSPGMERFIGHYPRLPRLVVEGPLLAYRVAYPGC
jgi:hypothetical protein